MKNNNQQLNIEFVIPEECFEYERIISWLRTETFKINQDIKIESGEFIISLTYNENNDEQIIDLESRFYSFVYTLMKHV